MLAPVPFDARRFVSNDGKCDPQGRFWFGPMDDPLAPAPDAEPEAGPLVRFDAATLRCVPMPHRVHVSNGLAWSPDGRTMYHADTKHKTIYNYEFDGRDGTDWRTVYVTSARQSGTIVDRVLHPRAGGVFAFEAPAPGVPTHLADGAYFVANAD